MNEFSKSEQHTLSIRLSTDGFSFSILNPLSEERPLFCTYSIDETRSFTANLKRAFQELEEWNRPYRRVNILQAGSRFTLVPLEFFDDEQSEKLFYHNFSSKENELVQYNILPKNSIVVLFGMDRSAHDFLNEQFPQAKFYSASAPLIEYLSIKSRSGNCRKIYALLSSEAISIYAYERGYPLLAKYFTCKATSDYIYYLLYVWKQLGLEPERDELHLSGTFTDKGQLLIELRKFIRQVFIMNPESYLELHAVHHASN